MSPRLLITQLLATANKHISIVAEAKRRFDLWASGQDKSAVHTNLRSAIFSLNVSEGGRKEYDAVKEEYLRTDSVDGKEICLAAMGRTKEPALVQDYLDFVFSDKVAIQDAHSGAVSLAANSKVRHLLWEYIKTNWASVEAHLFIQQRGLRTVRSHGAFQICRPQDRRGYRQFLQEQEYGSLCPRPGHRVR